MKRNEFITIDSAYLNIINEAKAVTWGFNDIRVVNNSKKITIPQIKEALLKLAKMTDWNTFVDSQKSGECGYIAKAVSKMFPKIGFYSVTINFSESAISKMDPDDDPEMFKCTHYFNMLEGECLDFGKGTNRYRGSLIIDENGIKSRPLIYVLDGVDKMYSCTYSSTVVQNYFTDIIERDPSVAGFYV